MTFNWKIFFASKWVKAGLVIAYPTESVYGLGCDPQNLTAVKRILQIKQRSYKKGLILVASDFRQIIPYIAEPSQQIIDRLSAPSDKVITWLIPANNNVSVYLTGEHQQSGQQNKKIAIRISRHPVIRSLCHQLGHPIVSTSANVSGKPMLWTAREVKLCFKDKIDHILNGLSGTESKPSEIRDIISDQLIRK